MNFIFSARAFSKRKMTFTDKTWLRVTSLVQKWQLSLLRPIYHIPSNVFDNILNSLVARLAHRGVRDTVKYVKQIRLAFQQSLLGKTKIPGVPMKHGFPRILGNKQITQQKEKGTRRFIVMRLILTIQYSTRAFSIGVEPNYGPIVSVSKGTSTLDPNEVKLFWRALGFSYRGNKEPRIPKQVRFSGYHFTTKSGPNGQALWTCQNDLMVLPEALIAAIKVVGGDKLAKNIDLLKGNLSKLNFNPISKGLFRTLSYFPDREDKVRVIAIQDYFSQTALKPLHSFLFGIQKRIPQDCTFSQGKLLESISKIEGKKYSFDLTAATDRFPIDFICSVLEGRFPKAFVKAWKHIMVEYPFKIGDKTISYATGNPMGAYTSWASFTLAHHFIIFSCCIEAGIKWDDQSYSILGDDIVIANDRVAEIYQRKMSELGVDINITKSHISDDMFEFAKRIFYTGVEISPFPISALPETSSKSYFLAELLVEQLDRGWPLPSVETSLLRFYEIVFNSNSSFRRKAAIVGFTVSQQKKAISGLLAGPEFIAEFCSRRNIPQTAEVTQEDFERMQSWIALEAFADANETIDKKAEGLGTYSVSEVIRLTSFDDIDFDLIPAIPQQYVHGHITEIFGDQNKKARLISTEGQDWPRILKTIAQPLTDRIYSERASRLMLKGTWMVLIRLDSVIRQFLMQKMYESR